MYAVALCHMYVGLIKRDLKTWLDVGMLCNSFPSYPSLDLLCIDILPQVQTLTMNALDSLFDFAALMSTSSAMTLPPPAPAQAIPPAKASTYIPPTYNPHMHQPPQPQYRQNNFYSQLVSTVLPIHQHKDRHTTLQVPQLERDLGSWHSAPLLSTQVESAQHHYGIWQPDFNKHTDLTHEFPCVHHPNQLCNCTSPPPTPECYGAGCAPLWDGDQLSSQQLGRVPQTLRRGAVDGGPGEYVCGDCYLGRPCGCWDVVQQVGAVGQTVRYGFGYEYGRQ
jgi:hypothetical protein